MICPAGSIPYETKNIKIDSQVFTARCTSCKIGTYSTLPSQLWVKENKGIKNSNLYADFISSISKSKPCLVCPVGGTCTNGIVKSRGNFYGYWTTNTSVEFLSCPLQYCCKDKRTCQSYQTCNKYRTGRLCGSCIENHQEQIFSTARCIKNADCYSPTTFWVIFTVVSDLCAVAVIYIFSFLSFIKRLFSKVWSIIKNFRKDQQKTVANEESTEMIEMHSPISIGCADDNQNIDSRTNIKPYTMSGIVSILISFYQIKSLLSIKVDIDVDTNKFQQILSQILNFKFLFEVKSSFCPLSSILT